MKTNIEVIGEGFVFLSPALVAAKKALDFRICCGPDGYDWACRRFFGRESERELLYRVEDVLSTYSSYFCPDI